MAQKPGKRMKLGVAFATVEYSMQGKTPTFHDLVAAVHAAEEMGVDSFWLADHLLYRFAERGEERGCWEAMTMLSALAAITTRIAPGPLVAATSFRHPALLAKMAATLDEISAGRFLLGVGAGWHQPEYAAFGYPFDHLASRFEEDYPMSKHLLSQLAYVEILSPRPAETVAFLEHQLGLEISERAGVLGRRSAVLGHRGRDPSCRETTSDASPRSSRIGGLWLSESVKRRVTMPHQLKSAWAITGPREPVCFHQQTHGPGWRAVGI